MTSDTYLSGIQATGTPHIGNFLGAISQWVVAQNTGEDSFFMVADYHAITGLPSKLTLEENRLGAMAGLIACGLDPEKVVLFFQSDVPEHAELSWLLSAFANFGELQRMTQFKAKSKNNQDHATMALFGYPVLQAADILIYQANKVPVGEDQIQHIELTRNIASRFNAAYGEVFTLPSATTPKLGARVMDFQYPENKMSKSGTEGVLGTIFLDDSNDAIKKKVSKSVTDSKNEVNFSPDQPGLQNIITVLSALSSEGHDVIVERCRGKGYGQIKSELCERLIATIEPIRTNLVDLKNDPSDLREIIENSTEKARERARATVAKVRDAMGFGL